MFYYRPLTLTLALLVVLAHGSVLADGGDTRTLLVEQGHFWQGKEKPKRASEVWNKLLFLDAAQPDALYGLAFIAVKEGDLTTAGVYLQRLQAIQPTPLQALLLEQDIRLVDPANQQLLDEARLLVENNERGKAAGVYRKALGGKPAQGQIGLEFYNNLGYVDGQWAEARSGMERIHREYPDDSYAELYLAKHLARNLSSRAEGIRALARLSTREDVGREADENWRVALTWIGPPVSAYQPLFEQFLLSHSDDDEIRALLAKGRSRTSSMGDAWSRDPVLDRGLKAMEKGQLVAAERDLTSYLKAHPNDADALGGLGVLRQRQERYDDAELLLTKAVRQPGGRTWRSALDDVRYWSLLQQARENRTRGRTADARQQLEQARRLKPKDSEALLTLAELQAQQGELAPAEASFRQALALRTQETRALRGLAQVLGEQGKSDDALRLLESLPKAEREKLGDLGSLRAEQALQRARAAEKRGDTQGMRQELERALSYDPNNAWARLALARLYVAMGAVDEARSLMDGLVAALPNDHDALNTSALLSMQLEDWTQAQALLARIPREARNADINSLVAEVDFNLQLQRINELSRSGSKAEARAFLGRIEPLAEGKLSRLTALATAYSTADDPQRAIGIMRDLLASNPRSDLSLTLSYGGVLLAAEQDMEVAAILRDVQGRSMTSEQRKQYDDLLFYYRVRQAEQLRERGDLAAAYDTLTPALAQRPQDPLAVSALARMYAANGDNRKAFELLKPLVQRNPNDASLQVGAAGMAARLRDKTYAEAALDRALKLAPNDVEILSGAAGVYRALGRSGKAEELLRKVVTQEQRQQTEVFAASTQRAAAPANPFAGIGSTSARTAGIPVPTAAISNTGTLSSNMTIPAPLGAPMQRSSLDRSYVATPSSGARSAPAPLQAAVNPFDVQPEVGEPDPRAGMSKAGRALDDIRQERSGYVVQGLSVRSNNSEDGLSKLTDVQAPVEINLPVGDDRLALRVTPVSLNAGSVSDDTKLRFGGGVSGAVVGLERYSDANPSATNDELLEKSRDLLVGSVGPQRDSGVGLALAWERPSEGLKADLGVSPLGFLYSTAIGGISLDRPLSSTGNLRYGVGLSRRVVTDSLTSFAGARDARTGLEWGGVTANGVRGQLSYDNGKVGVYGYGSAHALLGNNVKSNTRAELGSGIYWYLLNDDRDILTAGLSLTGIGYENNQNNFTYGNGGYFSPQNYFSIGVPVRWSHRTQNWSYTVRGSVGAQYFKQDSVPYYPNDKEAQSILELTSGVAASVGTSVPTHFAGSSDTGFSYNLGAAAEYRLGSNLFLGGQMGVDNAQDYRQWSGGLYLRVMFEDITGPMALPVSPYQSPYAN